MSENAHPIKTFRESQTPTLSQGQFGDRVGVTRFTVIRWENGSPIDEDKLTTVSEATGIPAKELRPDLADKYERIFGSVS
jgi:DNA-binding XRE family transcriptional regulator